MEYGRSDILQKLLVPVVEIFSLNRDQLFSLSSVLAGVFLRQAQLFVGGSILKASPTISSLLKMK